MNFCDLSINWEQLWTVSSTWESFFIKFTFVEKNYVVFPYGICTHQSNKKWISVTDSLLCTTKSATSVRYVVDYLTLKI